MGEVNGAHSVMATYASYGALVSLKHLPNASLTEMDKESKIFSENKQYLQEHNMCFLMLVQLYCVTMA